MYLFYSVLCSQRSVTSWGSSQDAGLQPSQFWAEKVLSEGVHLRGGGPDAVSWHHAAAQRDDGQISCSDGSITGVRSWRWELTGQYRAELTQYYGIAMSWISYNYIKGPLYCRFCCKCLNEWIPLCCMHCDVTTGSTETFQFTINCRNLPTHDAHFRLGVSNLTWYQITSRSDLHLAQSQHRNVNIH